MLRGSYHPKAFLKRKKNVKRGLAARTGIVLSLEGHSMTAKMLVEKIGTSYSSVLYHLHLMEDEGIAARQDGRPYVWRLTGAGQKTLTEI